MLQGKGVSEGIAFGYVKIIKKDDIQISNYKIHDVENELKNFKFALEKLKDEIEEISENLTGTEQEIMQAYMLILEDPTLTNETLRLIKEERYNSVYATEKGFNTVANMFKAIDDKYLSERADDILDMKNKLLEKLTNTKKIDLSTLPENTILVAKELSTSDTANINLANLNGIIIETGGETSHVVIMARNHEIPTIMSLENASEILKEKEYVAINGKTGEVHNSPNKEEIKNLKNMAVEFENNKNELNKFLDRDAVTLDNHKVEVVCNIGTTEDLDLVEEVNSKGIGLLRSEFLYMKTKNVPTEEQQFIAYKRVAETMKKNLSIIRTLDIGGDKDIKGIELKKEENPFLGYRAIRICLEDIPLFKAQLRAILRASMYGNLAIMLPMISSIEELRKAKKIIEETKKELEQEHIKFNNDIKVGIMVEVPSVAINAEMYAKECDFFSIGTNDLIQYTLAAERGNDNVAKLYNKFNPSIIKLIKNTIDAAHKHNIFCGVCGEAAGDERYIPLLLGLGLDEFSMNPRKVLKAKKIICNLKYEECKELSKKIIKMPTAREIEKECTNFILKSEQ